MYVIQTKWSNTGKWEFRHSLGRFKTLPDAQLAFDKLHHLDKKISRIAEEYTVTRYKAVNL